MAEPITAAAFFGLDEQKPKAPVRAADYFGLEGAAPKPQAPVEDPRFPRAEGPTQPVRAGDYFGIKAPKTAGDALSEVGIEQTPFVGQAAGAIDSVELYRAAQALERGDATDEQRARIQGFVDDSMRGHTIGYQATKILTDLPAYAIEFLAGGSVAGRLATKGSKELLQRAAAGTVKQTVGRVVRQGAEDAIAKALTKTVGAAATSAVQTATMPGRVLSAGLERELSKRIGLDEQSRVVIDGSLPSLVETLPEGFLDIWIENASEAAGGMVPNSLAGGALAKKLLGAYSKAVPNATVESGLAKLAKGVGWHGLVSEMGEERFGSALRAALLGDPWSDVIPSPAQAAAEALAFSVPGAIGGAARALSSSKAPRGTPEPSAQPSAAQAAPAAESQPESGAALQAGSVPAEGGAAPAAPVNPVERRQRLVQNLIDANVVAGVLNSGEGSKAKVVEPDDLNEIETWAIGFLTKRGVDTSFLDAGKPLGISAAHSDGAVVLDHHAKSPERVRALVFHELGHHIRAVDNQSWEQAFKDFERADPEGMKLALQEYDLDFRERLGAALGEQDESRKREEALSRYVEGLSGYIELAFRDPRRLVHLATNQAPLFTKIVDAFKRLMNKVLRTSFGTAHEARIKAFVQEAEALGAKSTKIDPRRAAALALRARELFNSVLGASIAPAVHQEVAVASGQSAILVDEEVSEPAPASTLEPASTSTQGDGDGSNPTGVSVPVRAEQAGGTEQGDAGSEAGSPAGPGRAGASGARADAHADDGARPAGAAGNESPGESATTQSASGDRDGDRDGRPAGDVQPDEPDDLSAIFDTIAAEKQSHEKEEAQAAPAPDVLTFKKAALIPTRAGIVTQELDEQGNPKGAPKLTDTSRQKAKTLAKKKKAAPTGNRFHVGQRVTQLGTAKYKNGTVTGVPRAEGFMYLVRWDGQPDTEPSVQVEGRDLAELISKTPTDAEVAAKHGPIELKPLLKPEAPPAPKTQLQSDIDDLNAMYAVEELSPEERRYQRALPIFQRASELVGSQADAKTLIRAIIELFMANGLAASKLANIKPDVMRFAKERLGAVVERPAPPPIDVQAASNYRIRGDEIEGGPKARARSNLEALKILKALRAEGRGATFEEQRALARWQGWGAGYLANNIFPDQYSKRFKPEWEKEGTELRELLTDAEYQAAAATTLNAHYTSHGVVRAMWGLLERLGFDGGRVLEPGAGSGNFIGLMPEALAPKVHYVAIEKDPTTAGIAAALYPKSDVRASGYEDVSLPHDSFDAAIGNPPFANITILADPEYRSKKLALHDYFFLKTLDRVRPGGVLMFITSRFTMDKVGARARMLIQAKADLIGAVRLPQTAFKENAGTDVVTDILILRKRVPGEQLGGEKWGSLADVYTSQGRTQINQYFVEHPEMVLGTNEMTGTHYAKGGYTVRPREGDIEEHLRAAFNTLPAGIYKPRTKQEKSDAPLPTMLGVDVRDGRYHVHEGKVYLRLAGTDRELFARNKTVKGGVPKAELEIVKSYIPLRDAVLDVYEAQLGDDAGLKKAQAKLAKQYSAFVEKHGAINKTVRRGEGEDAKTIRPNLLAFEDDIEAWRVAAIENWDEENSVAVRTPFFTERTIRVQKPAKIETAHDALATVLNDLGRVDIDEIARRLGADREATLTQLGTSVWWDPTAGAYVTDDAYLSGNVRMKLAVARELAEKDPTYQRHVEVLKSVMPTDLVPSQITAKLGASWVPPKDVEQFMRDVTGLHVRVEYLPAVHHWQVTPLGSRFDPVATSKWGTPHKNAYELLGLMLGNKTIEVKVKDSEGKYVVNVDATTQAQEKARVLQEEFEGWIWKDDARSVRLAAEFNEKFNSLVPRRYDGSHLKLDGLSEFIKLRPHQKNVVWRIIQSGRTYMAHGVGAGKTLAMATAAVELKRLGLANKPMVLVPNHMLAQFARETILAYPRAKIMVADEQQFSADRRKEFVSRVATNDLDAVFITYAAFGKLRPPNGEIERIIQEQIDALTAAVDETKDHDTIKELQKQKERLEQRAKKLLDESEKDEGVAFDEMGVDFLFVDEAHAFKRLDFVTNRTRIKGIQPVGSARSMHFFATTRYLDRLRPGRSLVMASGTPLTNTMAEAYTVQRYLQPEVLKDQGLEHFDAWASQYGDTISDLEPTPTGAIKNVERFARFNNVGDLSRAMREVMDIVTIDDLKDAAGKPLIARPERTVELVATERPDVTGKLMQEMADLLDQGGDWLEKAVRFLRVLTDAPLIAIDPRFKSFALGKAGTDENLPDSKLNTMIRRVHSIWNETHKVEFEGPSGTKITAPATQMIFSDMGLPGAEDKRGFSAYTWIKSELVRMGVPAEQIAFMQDYKKSDEKVQLFRAMNTGKVRILIGSTQTMGTGVNAQRLLYAMHHLDAPWTPADMEQRVGRIWRQGNLNKRILDIRYSTKETYDGARWSVLEKKQKFIDSFLRGNLEDRSVEDLEGGDANIFAQAKAIVTANPLLMEYVALDAEVTKLGAIRRGHERSTLDAKQDMLFARETLKGVVGRLAEARKLADSIDLPEFKEFALRVGETEHTDSDASDQAIEALAKKALVEALERKRDIPTLIGVTPWGPLTARLVQRTVLGKTFETTFLPEFDGGKIAHGELTIDVRTVSRRGVFNAVEKFKAEAVAGLETDQQRLEKKIETYKELVGATWPRQAEYEEKAARRARLKVELDSSTKKDNKSLPPVSFAIEPKITAEMAKQIRTFQGKAEAEGELTSIGSTPSAVANTSDDPRARAFSRAVREERANTDEVEVRPHEIVRAEAKALLGEGDAAVRRIWRKIDAGQTLTDTETIAADIASQGMVFAALETGDKRAYREAAKYRWLYQNSGRDTARALAARRGVKARSGRDVLADLLTIPTNENRLELDRLDKELRDAETTDERRQELLRQIERVLEKEAGHLEKAAKELRKLGLDPELITSDYFHDLVTKGRIVRTVQTSKSSLTDMFIEYRLASMLSGLYTQVVNVSGNTGNLILHQGIYRLAEVMTNAVVRDPNSAQFGEVFAYMRSWMPAFARALDTGWRAFSTELPVFEEDLRDAKGVPLQYLDDKMEGRGKAIPDKYGGRIIRIPLRMLLGFDEFFKSFAATTEAHALAFRKAKKEGLTGDALHKRTVSLVENHDQEIWLKSASLARRITFTGPSDALTRAGYNVRASLNKWFGPVPVGSILLPFVKTPVAIFKEGLSVPFYPAIALRNIARGEWKGKPERAVQDIARTSIAFMVVAGIMAMLAGPGDDDLPLITGSGKGRTGERDLQNRTVPAYSLRIPGTSRWLSFRRIDPAAVTIATIVDVCNEIVAFSRAGDHASAALSTGRVITSVADQLADKTFLRTLGDIYRILMDDGVSKSAVPRLVFGTAVLPMVPNIVRQPFRLADDSIRQSDARTYDDAGVWEATARSTLRQAFPLLTKQPPPRFDLWGRPLVKADAGDGYLLRELSPAPTSQLEARIDPLDRLIVRFNNRVDAGEIPDGTRFAPKSPDYWYTKDGNVLYWDDAELAELQQRSGEIAHARLTDRLSDNGLDLEKPTEKDVDVIKDALRDARARVRRDLIARRRTKAETQ